MAENKKFTGFKFIDEKLGGLLPNKLCYIGGDCDPIMGEQLSLLQMSLDLPKYKLWFYDDE